MSRSAGIPLIGYTDRLSARPGEALQVKVSSTADTPYRAELVRIISGDPNPEGPGVVTVPVAAGFAGDYPSRLQVTTLGSHMRADIAGTWPAVVTVSALVWPTTPEKGRQGIISQTDAGGAGFTLAIGGDGAEISCGGARAAVGAPMRPRAWYRVWAVLDRDAGTMQVGQVRLAAAEGEAARHQAEAPLGGSFADAAPLLVAAIDAGDPAGHFNGKIEAPEVHAGRPDLDAGQTGDPLASWDFSRDMHSLRVPGSGPLGGDGELVGAPARAMTGHNWDAGEMCWRHAPDQYGAIHFHDDDIADAGWETDFTAGLPDDLASGGYAIRLTHGAHWDMQPVVVCPPKGARTADLCVVVPTFTYVIYANQARSDFGPEWRQRADAWNAYPHNPAEHPGFGLSTYNDHSDGSGICHTTWHRPILNLRPGYHAFGDPATGSGLRHFPADTHLLAWLDAKEIAFDVVSDWEVHHEGAALLAPYKAVATCSHPEYHTTETLDAFLAYRDAGGRLIYLGGNGFYWRVALHAELDGLIEIRRAEGGLRAWASEPGEYYHAFDGDYGGTWRRNARPPQQLVGVGFTVQGGFEGTHYRRQRASYDPETAWIFAGVDDEVIGDFGLCGGGAAGYELDRTDARLGTPANVKVLATSEDHPDHFVLPPEEWLTHVMTWAKEPPEKLIRADMVYFDCPGGGAVFSVGSITFCGALPVNGFDNNVSRILENVVRRFTAE